MSLTLTDLQDRLASAARLVERMDQPNAGRVRFRFAVKWAEYGTSPVADLDPFGEIIGVTTALDGTTIIDVLAELAETRQETML